MKELKKAIELMDHYYLIVYPYVGSDFMTGTESPTLKFKLAKKEAIYLADHMLNVKFPYEPKNINVSKISNQHRLFWAAIRSILEQLTEETYYVQSNLRKDQK